LGVSGSDDKTMRIWDIQSKRLLRIYDENAGVINTVAFHPDGTCVASAGTDKTIKVWDIRYAMFRILNGLRFLEWSKYVLSTARPTVRACNSLQPLTVVCDKNPCTLPERLVV
jgi:WD40 repeat protein